VPELFRLEHDFEAFPELANSQMNLFYFQSPHKQIMEDITVEVVKVHDGDTFKVKWSERDFEFPVRMLDIDAPELKDAGGKESKEWLEARILGETIDLKISRNKRVGKWGRLLARVDHMGVDLGQESIRMGMSEPFGTNLNFKMKEVDEWA
jgi:endonuclease YncB( thermonuclease family)